MTGYDVMQEYQCHTHMKKQSLEKPGMVLSARKSGAIVSCLLNPGEIEIDTIFDFCAPQLVVAVVVLSGSGAGACGNASRTLCRWRARITVRKAR